MEQLSSCYFCGAALDASLDEYPVVPKALHPTEDDQKTVVLCQGCRRKLGTVVETIVSVFDQETLDERDAASGVATGGPSDAAGEDPPADDGWVDAGELSAGDGRTDDDVPAAAGDAPAATGDGPAADAGGSADAAGSTEDDGSDDVTYTTSTAAGGRKSVSGNAESIRDDDGSARGGGGATGGKAAANEDGAASSSAGGDGGAAGDDGPTMTALENTKVMRLLQNREFPVDREEIRTVAVNAYDMSESRFDKVVDAAIEKGLIDERNGQFVEGN